MCLEHSKKRVLICVDCQKNVCDTCALFGAHRGHAVFQKQKLLAKIHDRMDQLMENFQNLDKNCKQMCKSTNIDNNLKQIDEYASKLKIKAQIRIDSWKKQLDQGLIEVN